MFQPEQFIDKHQNTIAQSRNELQARKDVEVCRDLNFCPSRPASFSFFMLTVKMASNPAWIAVVSQASCRPSSWTKLPWIICAEGGILMMPLKNNFFLCCVRVWISGDNARCCCVGEASALGRAGMFWTSVDALDNLDEPSSNPNESSTMEQS